MNPQTLKGVYITSVIAAVLLVIILIAGSVSRGRLSKENEVLQNTNDTLVSQIEFLKTNNPAASIITALEQAGQALINQVAVLQAEKTAATSKIEELTKQVQALQATNDSLIKTMASNAATATPAGMVVMSRSAAKVTPGPGSGDQIFDNNGEMIGGVPALFVNRSGTNVTIYLQQKEGEQVAINMDLPPGERRYNLAPGEWSYRAAFGDEATKSSESTFKVSEKAKNIYLGPAGSKPPRPYHGGVEFRQ